MSRFTDSREALMRLASHRDGVTSSQVAAALRLHPWQAQDLMKEALKHALLLVPKVVLGKRIAQHYFLRQADADAWANRQMRSGLMDPSCSPTTGKRRHPPVNLRGTLGQRLDAAADVQPGAAPLVVRCPSWTHDPRYQCAPDEVPAGAGFAAAGVGRDLETGRAWGQ